VGHDYPGKQGLRLDSFYRFVVANPDVKIVGAHLGGGLPLYASNVHVLGAFKNLHVDTAAQPLIYDYGIYDNLGGAIYTSNARGDKEFLLFGSDYPLFSPKTHIAELSIVFSYASLRQDVLGETARRLLFGKRGDLGR
jgi:predicted TIM-barrel fold metal-dependent hydrolase